MYLAESKNAYMSQELNGKCTCKFYCCCLDGWGFVSFNFPLPEKTGGEGERGSPSVGVGWNGFGLTRLEWVGYPD